MMFRTSTVLPAIAALLSLAQLGLADECLDAPRVPGTPIGVNFSNDKKNLYNCDTKWKDGLVVSGMEVWSSQWQVKGIRLTYSDGTQSPIRGQTDDLNQWGSKISGKSGPPPDNGYGWDKIEWGTGEINKVRLWVNYNNGDGPDAVGRIQVWPNGADADQKKILDVGSDVGGDGGGVLVDNLGSGILIGMRTQSGAFLDTLELVFMDGRVKSAEVVHIDWPESIDDLNKKHGNIGSKNKIDAWIRNSNPVGGDRQEWEFTDETHETRTRTITQQTTEIIGANVEISVSAEVEIPLIANVGATLTAGAHWESQSMDSITNTDTHEFSYQIKQGGTDPLQPQHAIHCTVDAFTTHYDTEYNSTVRTTMSSGKKFDIRQKGKLVSVLYTEGVQDCKTVAINDVPSGANVKEGKDIAGSRSLSSLSASPASSPKTDTRLAALKRAIPFKG